MSAEREDRPGGADDYVTKPFSLEELVARVRAILRESSRMSELVDELLLLAAWTRVATSSARRVGLREIATAAVDAARPAAPDEQIDLDAPLPVAVLGDAARLRQLVDNLLENARGHTPEGTPVHVRALVADGEAVLQVADEGPGVPEEDAPRIFERFVRAGGMPGGGNGSGLGLSIVSAVAGAHGGRASYRPRPGGGALFEVRLPLRERS